MAQDQTSKSPPPAPRRHGAWTIAFVVILLLLGGGAASLISERHGDELVSAEGKAALEQAIAERTTSILQGPRVTDVLFTEFVVQF
jgi:hypothetical protein